MKLLSRPKTRDWPRKKEITKQLLEKLNLKHDSYFELQHPGTAAVEKAPRRQGEPELGQQMLIQRAASRALKGAASLKKRPNVGVLGLVYTITYSIGNPKEKYMGSSIQAVLAGTPKKPSGA